MGRKTAAASIIAQNNIAAEYTAPEMVFDRLFKGRVFKPPGITLTDEDGDKWTFSPDRQFIGTNVLVEIQGPYHRTKRQEQKTRWRNSELLAKGYRMLEIDTERLETKRYHAQTVAEVEAFLKGNRLTEHLFA
jgi:hypothetical protein